MLPNRHEIDTLHSEHRLLAILRLLTKLNSWMANLPLICDYLETVGLVASMEMVRTDLRILKEKGLVEVRESEKVWPTKLTQRGADTAEGRSIVEGIKRPTPDCGY